MGCLSDLFLTYRSIGHKGKYSHCLLLSLETMPLWSLEKPSEKPSYPESILLERPHGKSRKRPRLKPRSLSCIRLQLVTSPQADERYVSTEGTLWDNSSPEHPLNENSCENPSVHYWAGLSGTPEPKWIIITNDCRSFTPLRFAQHVSQQLRTGTLCTL